MAEVKTELDGRQQVMLKLAQGAADQGRHFFYILIREPLGPHERASRYENVLSDSLGDLGEITGGGSQLGENGAIEFCGIDLVVNDRERGLAVIRNCLRKCGAPLNTIVEEYIPQFRALSI